MIRVLFLVLACGCNHALAQEVIPLWPDGAPGFEHLADEPEKAEDWWVRNVHNPSLTAFLPEPGQGNGAAVIVFPGGGHELLVIHAEGTEVAPILNEIGVAVFVLKYRLARDTDSPYRLPEHSRQDAQRAIRLVRSRADSWGLDPERIGVMGFSAGGEVAAFVAYDEGSVPDGQADHVDQYSSLPSFQVLVYPGPLGVPDSIDVTAPPVFMVGAIDDPCCIQPVLDLLSLYKQAGIPAEAHVYDHGGHGFNLGQRSEDRSISSWTDRLLDWMIDSGLTSPEQD